MSSGDLKRSTPTEPATPTATAPGLSVHHRPSPASELSVQSRPGPANRTDPAHPRSPSDPDQGDLASAAPLSPPAPRRGLLLILVGGLVAVLVLTLALLWLRGEDDGVRTTAGSAAVQDGDAAGAPAEPEALAIDVQAPTEVVAGAPAGFEVTWTDGEGMFAGSLEEWGDGVGAGSLEQGQCPVSTDKPADGGYVVQHTFTKPGTYEVVLGVTTYTCSGKTATMEEARQVLTVEVAPAG